MNERVQIEAFWGRRQETVESCARRLAGFLNKLHEIDAFFTNWNATGWSRKEATRLSVQVSECALRDHLLDRNKRKDPDLGFSYDFWTESGDRRLSAKVTGTCGHYCSVKGTGWNNTSVLLPVVRATTNPFLKEALLKKCLLGAVAAWEPNWAAVTIPALLRINVAGDPPLPEEAYCERIGWITWLPAALSALEGLPTPVQVEPFADNGSVVVIKNNDFEVPNPDAVALVARVRSELRSRGVLKPVW